MMTVICNMRYGLVGALFSLLGIIIDRLLWLPTFIIRLLVNPIS